MMNRLSNLGCYWSHKIAQMNYKVIETIQRAMSDKRRFVAFIHRLLNTLRLVARHGKSIEIETPNNVANLPSEIRFQNSSVR